MYLSEAQGPVTCGGIRAAFRIGGVSARPPAVLLDPLDASSRPLGVLVRQAGAERILLCARN